MTGPYLFHSTLGPAIVDYLALKHALGRQFDIESRVLADLDRFLAARPTGAALLTPESFASWCLTLEHLTCTTRRARMRIVRNLCLYVRRRDHDCFVPDPAAFPAAHGPRRPYIFSEQEILRLLQAAAALQPQSTSPLCAATYRLAVVLLYTAGLRRGELVRLALSDYDPAQRTLLIRASKFHKSRLVALSPDAAHEMDIYLFARHRLPCHADAPLLVSVHRGLRARSGPGLGLGLRRLMQYAGVHDASGRPPRVHDLRHTYAVHVLLHWYRSGADVQAKLPTLAAAMGHVSIVSTAYYLTFLEPIARAASERFARHCSGLLAHVPRRGGDQ